MSKKMTSPQKNPPTDGAITVAVNGTPPSLPISESSKSALDVMTAPTLTPPASASQNDAIGAAVWNTDKRVNGLYTTFNARNSWMSINGTGWVKLTTNTDAACEAMTILASAARAKNSRIDYAIDAGITTEIYVW